MAALIRIVTPIAALIPVLGGALALPPSQASGPLFPTMPAKAARPPQVTFHTTPAVERWRSLIAEASQRFAIPQSWIAAVMAAESAGLTELNGRPITSRRGAMGLMQVMPQTWGSMRDQLGLGDNPYDPRDNILAGAGYLKAMYLRFGYPGLFAAYNAGPARYEQHLRTGEPLPGETRAYIALLAQAPAAPDMPPAILSGTRLFFTLGTGEALPHTRTQNPSSDGIQIAPDAVADAKKPPAVTPTNAPILPSSGGLFVPMTPSPRDRR